MFYVKLNTITEIQEFVKIVTRQEFDIDLASGRYLVDAKSIMGIFSLNLMDKIKVIAHTENIDAIKEELKTFIVEE